MYFTKKRLSTRFLKKKLHQGEHLLPWKSNQCCIYYASYVLHYISGYGMTELCPLSHLCPAAIENKPGSVGVLLPKMECKVCQVQFDNQ